MRVQHTINISAKMPKSYVTQSALESKMLAYVAVSTHTHTHTHGFDTHIHTHTFCTPVKHKAHTMYLCDFCLTHASSAHCTYSALICMHSFACLCLCVYIYSVRTFNLSLRSSTRTDGGYISHLETSVTHLSWSVQPYGPHRYALCVHTHTHTHTLTHTHTHGIIPCANPRPLAHARTRTHFLIVVMWAHECSGSVYQCPHPAVCS